MGGVEPSHIEAVAMIAADAIVKQTGGKIIC